MNAIRVDVRGTKIAAGVLTPEGEVLALLPENQGASGERGHVTIQQRGPAVTAVTTAFRRP